MSDPFDDLSREFPPVTTAEWESQIAHDLKGRDPKTLVWTSADGIEVKPFYRAGDAVPARELYSTSDWKIGCEVSDAESARYAISRGAQVLYLENDADLTGVPLERIEVLRHGSPDLLSLGRRSSALPVEVDEKDVARAPVPAASRLVGTRTGQEACSTRKFSKLRVPPADHSPAAQLAIALRQPPPAALELPVGPDYFIEIAKFRAARRLFPAARIIARTTKRNLTIYDPYLNLLRGTTEAMSAILGGCDVLVVRPFDAAYENPGEFSRRLSINTQLLLRDESYFNRIPDPAAGCWYLEWLTDQLVTKARELARAGTPPERVEHNKIFVGVNRYADPSERASERLTIAPDEDRDPWMFEKPRLEAERK